MQESAREDFDFYEDNVENESVEIEGITGNVTSYTFTGVSYPCIIFKEDFSCPKHKLTVVSNMVKSGSNLIKDISLYFLQKGELFKIGSLSGLQVGAFLDLVGVENVNGFYDSSTQLVKDKLYTLCTVV